MGKWFSADDEPPEELKGLTKEQLIAAVASSKKVTELETQIADATAKLTDANTKLSEIDTLKATIADLNRKLESAKPPAPTDDKRRTSFLDDEDAAFNERAMPIVNGVLSIGAQVSKIGFENSLSGTDKRIYQKYSGEVEELMSKEAPQIQASPKAWSTALDIIKGRHMNDITKAAQDKTDFFAETSGGVIEAGPTPAIDKTKLTPEEEVAARKYGLKPEEYLEAKKSMVVYHG